MIKTPGDLSAFGIAFSQNRSGRSMTTLIRKLARTSGSRALGKRNREACKEIGKAAWVRIASSVRSLRVVPLLFNAHPSTPARWKRCVPRAAPHNVNNTLYPGVIRSSKAFTRVRNWRANIKNNTRAVTYAESDRNIENLSRRGAGDA